MRNGNEAVDTVDVEATWQRLAARLGSQLIDVRTRAEWAYVGIPDLGPLGKRAVLVEWQTFPDQTVDPRFAERLASELGALGVKFDDDLFFICRSGSRSLAAAKAMAAEGYRACHNDRMRFSGTDGAVFEAYRELIEEVASEAHDAEGPFDDHGRILVTTEALTRVMRSA